MKVWVADELGQIKSCTIEKRAPEDSGLVSDITVVSPPEEHDRSDYVQVMALVKWDSNGQSIVTPRPLAVCVGNAAWLTFHFCRPAWPLRVGAALCKLSILQRLGLCGIASMNE